MRDDAHMRSTHQTNDDPRLGTGRRGSEGCMKEANRELEE